MDKVRNPDSILGISILIPLSMQLQWAHNWQSSLILQKIPNPYPNHFYFVDTPTLDSNDFTIDNDFEINLEVMFQEYGLMYPELSTA